ncbi:hypothetical protein [Bacillus salipaludis]|uniref:hypothetical protein n=1 Tax=Bacillus salipaludis TaxID=2547811 RepID=UPI002E1B76FD|nr:hypothetical protein [Bacillus salipaludis]
MDVIIERACGLDVHKDNITASSNQAGTILYKFCEICLSRRTKIFLCAFSPLLVTIIF